MDIQSNTSETNLVTRRGELLGIIRTIDHEHLPLLRRSSAFGLNNFALGLHDGVQLFYGRHLDLKAMCRCHGLVARHNYKGTKRAKELDNTLHRHRKGTLW